MSLNTVNDVPNIVERIRSACSRNEMRLVDVSKKCVPNSDKYGAVVEKLSMVSPVMVRWVDGFVTNKILIQNMGQTRFIQPLVMVSYKDKCLQITEATKLPTENFHLYIRNLFTEETKGTCVACMELVDDIIPCTTCCNDVFCSDCMIDAIDENDQLSCPLCRCPDFWKNSFLGSFGAHPDLFAKLTRRYQRRNNPREMRVLRFLQEQFAEINN